MDAGGGPDSHASSLLSPSTPTFQEDDETKGNEDHSADAAGRDLDDPQASLLNTGRTRTAPRMSTATCFGRAAPRRYLRAISSA